MGEMNQIDGGGVISSNKLLLSLLIIAVIATVWTALNGDNTSDDNTVDVVVQKSVHGDKRLADRIQSSDKNPQVITNKFGLIPWQKLKRVQLKEKSNELFRVHSWVVIPPVKKVKALPPPPPVAPPAPFTYIGKLEESPKGTQVFLMENSKLFTVVKGEKIDQLWRLDSEDANTLRLTYLPLGLVRILSKSAKQPLPATAEMN